MERERRIEQLSWKKMQDEMADENGLAIVVVEKNDDAAAAAHEGSVVVSKSNNNSICEHLYPSAEFAPLCAEYCGKAYENATRAGRAVHVKCHADLNFLAVPVEAGDKKLVAIVGRSFLKSEEYRKATARAAGGDWQQFPADEFFSNVLISTSARDLEQLAARFESLSDEQKLALAEYEKGARKLPEEVESAAVEVGPRPPAAVAVAAAGGSPPPPPPPPAQPSDETAAGQAPEPDGAGEVANLRAEKVPADSAAAVATPAALPQEVVVKPAPDSAGKLSAPDAVSEELIEKNAGEIAELASWRSLFGSLLNLNYREACTAILKFLGKRYKISNLGWLERRDNHLSVILASGTLRIQQMQISISAGDPRLLEAVHDEAALEFRERQTEETPDEPPMTIQLFPVAVGSEIFGAVIVGDEITDKSVPMHIARFLRSVASELEILRLREEIERQMALSNAVRKFNQSLKNLDADVGAAAAAGGGGNGNGHGDAWESLAQTSAEIMQAERSSLLMFDEDAQEFVVKAAIGSRAEIIRQERKNLGGRVARQVFREGRPLIVRDVGLLAGIEPAPAEWKYKTRSFISYPIIINGKKIGVLNISDKIDGSPYDEADLRIMNTFAPQLAVALDRTWLKRKAGEYERLSITDPLTGLLNRRYLEERLTEEIKRWERDGLPVSFMMIDVDDFKGYNDTFTHPEGDKALKVLGQILRGSLRGVDVAARYGGEEFSILLPQTSLSEACVIGERIRERVENTTFPNRKVTISVGIAACSVRLRTPQDLILAADKALYQAKREGRNRVHGYREYEEADNLDGGLG